MKMMFQKHFIRLNQCNKLISASHQLRPCSSKPKPKLPKRGGPTFKDFLAGANLDARPKIRRTPEDAHPYVTEEMIRGDGQKVYLDVYGCQMNVNDTEVVWSVLESRGYERTLNPKEADVWLLVTCSIREGAENKIWNKLKFIRDNSKVKSFNYKPSLKIGLLGCMAERLKDQMLQTNLVDLVAGPDSYRDLPRLLAVTKYADDSAINVILSLDETYADVIPSRLDKKSVTGFVSIQRGCDNMCSYCIVPFTRGRERSRPVQTILNEVKILVEAGVKEVTLLGQNVNSYLDKSKESMAIFGTELATTITEPSLAKGFKSIYKPKLGGLRFSDLLQKVSEIDPEVRIRFTSPHPKDFPDEVLHLISSTPNICNQLHLPAQCGSSRILEEMRRGYTRESYLELVDHVRNIIPDVRLSGDMIGGFCGETDEEFEETMSLIEKVKYGNLFCFQYSLREVNLKR